MAHRSNFTHRQPAHLPKIALHALRRDYFARAGTVARRYGIAFDQVIGHLWRARGYHDRVSIRAIRCLDDLVHAVACTDAIAVAWSDLADLYERPLIRHCQFQLDETVSLVAVRRLFAQLRQSDRLQGYDGRIPLRTWLIDALLELLATEQANRWPEVVPRYHPGESVEQAESIPSVTQQPGPAIACHVVARPI
jgi:hypothetical protein